MTKNYTFNSVSIWFCLSLFIFVLFVRKEVLIFNEELLLISSFFLFFYKAFLTIRTFFFDFFNDNSVELERLMNGHSQVLANTGFNFVKIYSKFRYSLFLLKEIRNQSDTTFSFIEENAVIFQHNFVVREVARHVVFAYQEELKVLRALRLKSLYKTYKNQVLLYGLKKNPLTKLSKSKVVSIKTRKLEREFYCFNIKNPAMKQHLFLNGKVKIGILAKGVKKRQFDSRFFKQFVNGVYQISPRQADALYSTSPTASVLFGKKGKIRVTKLKVVGKKSFSYAKLFKGSFRK